MNQHRPFMLTGPLRDARAANDATADESECVEDMAPGAAIVAFVAMWLAENRFAVAVGIYIGCMVTVGLAWCVEQFL